LAESRVWYRHCARCIGRRLAGSELRQGSPVILAAAVGVVIVIAAGIILINRRAYSCIEELEDV